MGKIISVVSNSKRTGKTVFTYLLANKIKEIYKGNIRILICCLNQKYSGLYRLLEIEPSEVGLEDIINHKYFEEEKQQYLISVIPKKNNIYFLGSYKTTNTFAQKHIDHYRLLFGALQRYFDIILVDTVSGSGNVITKLVSELSNSIICLVSQDIDNLNELKEYLSDQHHMPAEQMVYAVSQYRDIYPKISEIRSKYGIHNAHKLYYCETLQEMKNRESLHLYLQHQTRYNNTLTDICNSISEVLPQKQVPVTAKKYSGILAEILGGR